MENEISEKIEYLNKVAEKNSANFVKLRDVAKDTAEFLIEKFRKLEIDEVIVNSRRYYLKKVSATSGFSETFFCVEQELEGELIESFLDCRSSFFYAGDFNCKITRSSKSALFDFARNINNILDILIEKSKSQIDETTELIDKLAVEHAE